MFVVQSEQSSRQEQHSKELFDKTVISLEVVKSSSSNVEYILHEQVSRVLDNLLAGVTRRAEPIQMQLDYLSQQREGRLQSSGEMEKVLLQMRQFIEDLPEIIKESVVDKKVSSQTSMTVGSSAWFDNLVKEFHESHLSPEQVAFAASCRECVVQR